MLPEHLRGLISTDPMRPLIKEKIVELENLYRIMYFNKGWQKGFQEAIKEVLFRRFPYGPGLLWGNIQRIKEPEQLQSLLIALLTDIELSEFQEMVNNALNQK